MRFWCGSSVSASGAGGGGAVGLCWGGPDLSGPPWVRFAVGLADQISVVRFADSFEGSDGLVFVGVGAAVDMGEFFRGAGSDRRRELAHEDAGVAGLVAAHVVARGAAVEQFVEGDHAVPADLDVVDLGGVVAAGVINCCLHNRRLLLFGVCRRRFLVDALG